jgi:hypothetical protein
VAVPSQWEGTLEDGRALYIRYRFGRLTVGAGDGVDGAVRNSVTRSALHVEEIGDSLEGYMTTDEMKDALRQVLVFPPDLVVEGDRILTSSVR